jgi:acetyl/propionyl-CoA carboxylase alpha subunit
MIPSDFDPNLALVVLWGDSIQETKERASQFLSETIIEGKNSKNDPIITNMEYLHNNLDRLLTF